MLKRGSASTVKEEPGSISLWQELSCESAELSVIVRVAFDEGVLTGKYRQGHRFPDDDFRSKYFAGDRLTRAVDRVTAIEKGIAGSGYTMPEFALKFVLAEPAVSSVVVGMRNAEQARANAAVADLPAIPGKLLERMRAHRWLRANWYGGK